MPSSIKYFSNGRRTRSRSVRSAFDMAVRCDRGGGVARAVGGGRGFDRPRGGRGRDGATAARTRSAFGVATTLILVVKDIVSYIITINAGNESIKDHRVYFSEISKKVSKEDQASSTSILARYAFSIPRPKVPVRSSSPGGCLRLRL